MTQVEVLDAGELALDTVVGGGALALDAVRRPRRTARTVQRRGAQATAAAQRQVEEAYDVTTALPERMLHSYLRAVKRQSTRKDVVGSVARTILNTVNQPAGDAAKFFTRIEKLTELPKRARRATTGRPSVTTRARTTASRARATATGRRSTSRGTATRSTATRRTTGTRRTARRSA